MNDQMIKATGSRRSFLSESARAFLRRRDEPRHPKDLHKNIAAGIDKNWSEKNFRKYIEPFLEEHFEITREVTGWNDWLETPMKIDLIIKPKFEWHIQYLGVEFKKPKLSKTIDLYQWIRQCGEYHYTDWGKYGKALPVLMCPGLDFIHPNRSQFVAPGEDDGFFRFELTRFMSSFGVGELAPSNRGLEIKFCRTHSLWNTWRGLNRDGQSWKLDRKGH